MNQTQHQRWAYRSAGLQALIESTAHNKNAGSSCAFQQKAFSQPRASMLDDVGMSLASAQQTQAQVRIGTVCICEQNTMRENSHRLL